MLVSLPLELHPTSEDVFQEMALMHDEMEDELQDHDEMEDEFQEHNEMEVNELQEEYSLLW